MSIGFSLQLIKHVQGFVSFYFLGFVSGKSIQLCDENLFTVIFLYLLLPSTLLYEM